MIDLSLRSELADKYITEAIIWGAANRKMEVGGSAGNTILDHFEIAKVMGLALAYIMKKRQGMGCGSKDLAYADHYFQSRVMVGFTGMKPMMQVLVIGYETKKKIYEALGILEEMSSDKQCPSPVSPDGTSVFYGMLGAEHGELDFRMQIISEIAYSLHFWNR